MFLFLETSILRNIFNFILLLFPKVESITKTYIKFLKIYYGFIYLSLLIDVFHLVLGINSFMTEAPVI